MSENRHTLRMIEGESDQTQMSVLLNSAFSVPKGQSFLDDFPVWDEKNRAPIERWGVFQGNSLKACAGLRMAQIKTQGSAEQKVAVLGIVATEAQSRGQGLASELIEKLVERARLKGVQAILLFGADAEFYRKRGFEPVGSQLSVPIEILDLNDSADKFLGVRIGRGWTDGLMSLLQSRPLGLKLAQSDLQWLSSHRGSDWWWLGDVKSPSAYLCLDRGIDLNGYVHEWGGNPEEVQFLLAKVMHSRKNLLLMCNYKILEASGLGRLLDAGERVLEAAPLCLSLGLSPGWAPPEDLWLWGLDGA